MEELINRLHSKLGSFYGQKDFYPLHIPTLDEIDKKYLIDCIDSTFVSSVGKEIVEAENQIAAYTGAGYAIATVNGTAALHVAMRIVGVEKNTEVLTQPLTFVATANAISYLNAIPVFLDVDLDTMGLSPVAVQEFLEEHAEVKDGQCFNKKTGRRISACVPMHTFGFACRIEELVSICKSWCIPLVEDSAEALGSFCDGKHLGTYGDIGVLSFNGNKVITSGGGGMLITNNESFALKAKHLTTTAKVPHKWEYVHDEIGYNYRMPNLNAALLLGQLQKLDKLLDRKKELFEVYQSFFAQESKIKLREGRSCEDANYWLIAIEFENVKQRDEFLDCTNNSGIMTRPIWELMNELPAFKSLQDFDCPNAKFLQERIVNIPSSPYL